MPCETLALVGNTLVVLSDDSVEPHGTSVIMWA